MKRLLFFGLALLLLGSGLFADDAKVMPKQVGRFYIAPNLSFARGAYDEDGNLQKWDHGSVNVENIGFALEYGILDWLTGALQWVPGVTARSTIEGASGTPNTNINGVGDLFLGAKIQILGEKGLVNTDMFRFCIAPGLKIPMPGPDFEKEVENAGKGDKATFANMDNHVWGGGARFYFDWLIHKNFYINFYNETIFDFTKRDLNEAGPNLAGAKGGLAPMAGGAAGIGYGLTQIADPAAMGGLNPFANPAMVTAGQSIVDGTGPLAAAIEKIKGEVDYKYQLTFEIEPVYSTTVSDGIIFSAGLPINYKYKPTFKYTIEGREELLAAVGGLMGPLFSPAVGVGDYINSLPDGVDPNIDALKGGYAQLGSNAGLAGALVNDTALLNLMKIDPKESHLLSLNPNISLFFLNFPMPLELKFSYSIPVWGKSAQATNTIALQLRLYFRI